MGKKSKTEASAEESVVEQSLTETGVSGLSYEEKVERALPIAHPMATRKLAKRAYKVTKKCKTKTKMVIGLKNVKKAIVKGVKGFVLLAGDADPMDIVSHLPILCEENKIPYIWVPCKRDLGMAAGKGSALTILLQSGSEYEELYDEVYQKIKDTPLPV